MKMLFHLDNIKNPPHELVYWKPNFVIQFPKVLGHICKTHQEALLLAVIMDEAELAGFDHRPPLKNGWFKCSTQIVARLIGMSAAVQRPLIKSLVRSGFLEQQQRKEGRFLRLGLQNLQSAFERWARRRCRQLQHKNTGRDE